MIRCSKRATSEKKRRSVKGRRELRKEPTRKGQVAACASRSTVCQNSQMEAEEIKRKEAEDQQTLMQNEKATWEKDKARLQLQLEHRKEPGNSSKR